MCQAGPYAKIIMGKSLHAHPAHVGPPPVRVHFVADDVADNTTVLAVRMRPAFRHEFERSGKPVPALFAILVLNAQRRLGGLGSAAVWMEHELIDRVHRAIGKQARSGSPKTPFSERARGFENPYEQR